jgi:hypothetical protein
MATTCRTPELAAADQADLRGTERVRRNPARSIIVPVIGSVNNPSSEKGYLFCAGLLRLLEGDDPTKWIA